jgi:hypothetical protein
MTLASRFIRAAAIVAVVTTAALPLGAQTPNATTAARRRSALPPGVPTVKISGIITDASTGKPLAGAVASSDGRPSLATGTDGKYELLIVKGRNVAVVGSQFAYFPKTQPIFGQEGAVLNFALDPKPTVTVKLTAPQGDPAKDTYELEIDSSQFAYLIPFSGYARADAGNFCKDDGTSFTPDKHDIKRVIGPATAVSFSKCCTIGPIMKATLEMKNGQVLTVYFNDSCFGNEVDFLGREKSSGLYQYFKFTDIAEVDFP